MTALMRRRMMMAAKEQGGGGLPDAFQQVEWIGTPTNASNKPYINTGIIANATEYHMTAKYLNTVSSDAYGLGARLGDGSATQCCFFGRYNANSQWAWQGYFYGPNAPQDNIHIVDAVFQNGSQVITVDGTTNTYSRTGDFNGTLPFFVFGRNQGDGTIGGHALGMRYYYLKMWLDDVLVRDYIPCYRKSDGEIGMYDLVSNSFFTNAGSSTFEKGDDV